MDRWGSLYLKWDIFGWKVGEGCNIWERDLALALNPLFLLCACSRNHFLSSLPPTQQLAPNQSSHCATSIRSQQRIVLLSTSTETYARCPDRGNGSVQFDFIGPLCLAALITHFYSSLWRRLQDRYRGGCVSKRGNGTVLWGPGTLGGAFSATHKFWCNALRDNPKCRQQICTVYSRIHTQTLTAP